MQSCMSAQNFLTSRKGKNKNKHIHVGSVSNSLPMIYDSICGQQLIQFRNPNLIITTTVQKASNNFSLLEPIFHSSNAYIFNTQVHQLGSNLRPHPNNRNCQRSSKRSPHIDNIYHLQNEQLKKNITDLEY